MAPSTSRTLIVGLGNELLMDDGVGVHAARKLRRSPPRGAVVVEVGTAVLDALHLFEHARRIVAMDAMQACSAPGTVYAFGPRDVDQNSRPASLHELSLVAALGFLRDREAREVIILGVEPETIDYGVDLSAPVRAALPKLVQAAKDAALGQLLHTGGNDDVWT